MNLSMQMKYEPAVRVRGAGAIDGNGAMGRAS